MNFCVVTREMVDSCGRPPRQCRNNTSGASPLRRARRNVPGGQRSPAIRAGWYRKRCCTFLISHLASCNCDANLPATVAMTAENVGIHPVHLIAALPQD